MDNYSDKIVLQQRSPALLLPVIVVYTFTTLQRPRGEVALPCLLHVYIQGVQEKEATNVCASISKHVRSLMTAPRQPK